MENNKNLHITFDNIIDELNLCIQEVKSDNYEPVDKLKDNIRNYLDTSSPSEEEQKNIKQLVAELKNQINLKIISYQENLEQENKNIDAHHKYLNTKNLKT